MKRSSIHFGIANVVSWNYCICTAPLFEINISRRNVWSFVCRFIDINNIDIICFKNGRRAPPVSAAGRPMTSSARLLTSLSVALR